MTQPAPAVRRRHPVDVNATPGSLLRDLIDEITPDYGIAKSVERRAIDLAQTILDTEPAQSWPTTPDDVNEEWLDREVTRRRGAAEQALHREVIDTLIFDAHANAIEAIEQHVDDLLEELNRRLQTLVVTVIDASNAMGDDVRTAADAINAGVAEHWKTVADARPVYDDIRTAQRRLYQCDRVMFDELRAGDGVRASDPEARLYYHWNLNEVAPRWRGWTDFTGADNVPEYPWPNDPVERLLWFVANNSGIWCPTPRQIEELWSNTDVPTRIPLDAMTAG